MRIRLSGEFGGIVMVIMAGIGAAGIISGILNFLKNNIFKENKGVQKLLTIISTLVWLAAAALVILDLTNVYPLIRYILFQLLK